MHIVEQLSAQLLPEERLLVDWQLSLAVRISQVLEEQQLTLHEFAAKAGISEDKLDALLHSGADPSLSLLAQISARLNTELLFWKDADVVE
jgi:transcriptional regulator with XRE-family HTH domain